MFERVVLYVLFASTPVLAQRAPAPDPAAVEHASREFQDEFGETPRNVFRRIGAEWPEVSPPSGRWTVVACAHLFDPDNDVALGAAHACNFGNTHLLLQEEARRVARLLGPAYIARRDCDNALVDCVDAVTTAELLERLPAADWAPKFAGSLHRSMGAEHLPALWALSDRLQAANLDAAAETVLEIAIGLGQFTTEGRRELGLRHCRSQGIEPDAGVGPGLDPILAAVLGGIADGRPTAPSPALTDWVQNWLLDSAADSDDAAIARRLADHGNRVWRRAGLRIAIDGGAVDVIEGFLEDPDIAAHPLGLVADLTLNGVHADAEATKDYQIAFLEHDPAAFARSWQRHGLSEDVVITSNALSLWTLLRPHPAAESSLATAMVDSDSLPRIAVTLAAMPGTRTPAVLDRLLELAEEQAPRPCDFPSYDDELDRAGQPTAEVWTWALAAAELHAPDRLREVLRRWSDSPDARVREFARCLLLRLGDPPSAAMLLEFVAETAKDDARFGLGDDPLIPWLDLARSRGPSLVEFWQEHLARAQDTDVALESVWPGLGLIAAETSPRLVLRLLSVGDWSESVRRALAESRSRDAVWGAALRSDLDHEYPAGIGELDDSRVVPWLRTKVAARSETFHAIVDLAIAGDPEGVRMVHAALSSPWYRFVSDARPLRDAVLASPGLRSVALDLVATNCCASAESGLFFSRVLVPRFGFNGDSTLRKARTLRPYIDRLRFSHVARAWTAIAKE